MYPDTNQRDTTKALWERLYLVRLPRLEVSSVEYLQTYGTYITGDKAIDQTSANHLITTMKPIHELADYHKQHVAIHLVHAHDAVEIYKAVFAHLEAWETKLRFGMNVGDAPVEDLIALESFARSVYFHAQHRMPAESATSSFIQGLLGFARPGPLGFIEPPKPMQDDSIRRFMAEDPKDPQPTDHLAEFLRNHIGSLNIHR